VTTSFEGLSPPESIAAVGRQNHLSLVVAHRFRVNSHILANPLAQRFIRHPFQIEAQARTCPVLVFLSQAKHDTLTTKRRHLHHTGHQAID